MSLTKLLSVLSQKKLVTIVFQPLFFRGTFVLYQIRRVSTGRAGFCILTKPIRCSNVLVTKDPGGLSPLGLLPIPPQDFAKKRGSLSFIKLALFSPEIVNNWLGEDKKHWSWTDFANKQIDLQLKLWICLWSTAGWLDLWSKGRVRSLTSNNVYLISHK